MPSHIRWTFALLGTLACVPSPRDPSPQRPRVLLGVVDTILKVPRGQPFGAAASAERAYITLHGPMHALSIWDFRDRSFADAAIVTGMEPTNVAFAPDGRAAFVASQLSYRIDRIDVSAARLDGQWHTPANDPFQVAVSPQGDLAVATGNAGWIYLFDTRTGESRGAVEVGGAPNGAVISPDGSTVYLTNLRSNEVGRVDVRSQRYRPLGRMDAAEGQGIVLSPSADTLYTVSEDAGRLYAFDAVTGRRLAVRPTGPSPFGLAMTPDGSELWVTTLTGDLIRYRRSDLVELARTSLGGRLRRIAIDPLGRGAVVADETGRVIVLR